MDATMKELDRPATQTGTRTTHRHDEVTFPPIRTTQVKKVDKYVFCHQLDDISTMENGNLCNLVNCSGTEPHTEVYTEKPSYQITPYNGA